MRASFIGVLCCLGVTLGGCAGTIHEILDRPLTSDHLDEVNVSNKLKTVSGDRRLVRVSRLPDNTYVICAETQADAISVRGAKDSLQLNAELKSASESTGALTLTNTRTEVSDVVRQLSWQLCNARMNGYIERDDYLKLFESLQADAFAALKAKAGGAGTGAGAGTTGPKPGAVAGAGATGVATGAAANAGVAGVTPGAVAGATGKPAGGSSTP